MVAAVASDKPNRDSENGADSTVARRSSRPETAATGVNAKQVACMLAVALRDVPAATYLVPSPGDRLETLAAQFAIVTAHALQCGGITTSGTAQDVVEAAVVWLDHTQGPPAPISDYDARLRDACGPYTPAFTAWTAAVEAHHPTEPHRCLTLLGTRPDRQGRGAATGLLETMAGELDATATAAYLEALSPEAVKFCERFGFTAVGKAYPVGPDGPLLYPMWRPVRP